MKINKLFPLLAVGAFALLGQQVNAVQIDINSVDAGGSGLLRFTGNTDSFQFINSAGGFSFSGVGPGGPVGSGSISGTYTIGAITVAGPTQTAPVSGSGVLTIDDNGATAGGSLLTANVSWVSIFTMGTGGGLNAGGSVNLTSIAYTGLNADLIALRSGLNNSGIGSIEFGFVPAQNLTQLTANGQVNDTTFSGDLFSAPIPTVPDGGSTVALLGGALLGIGALRRFIAAK